MKLLQQLNEIAKNKPIYTNLVAKHSQQKTGAGTHEEKKGKKSSRARQKTQWKKEQY
jgi:hypothetical protein